MALTSDRLRSVVVDGVSYAVYGCADEDTPAAAYDYFEMADEQGTTLALGEPFFHDPSNDEVALLVRTVR